jgi:hypothetical protein
MTALPHPVPNHSPRPAPPTTDAATELHQPIVAGADVPIAVWRLDDRPTEPGADAGNGIAVRLAQRLVGVYTIHGDAVIDLDHDPHLQAASIRACRSYVRITDPRDVAGIASLAAPATLAVLHWPSRNAERSAAGVADLLAACRRVMTAGSCTIAAVTSAEPGQAGATFAHHLARLLPAARAAGFTPVLQIVAVAVTGGRGDQFLYYATPAEADAARHARPAGVAHPHIDLLVFSSLGPGNTARLDAPGENDGGDATHHDSAEAAARPCPGDAHDR